MRIRSPIERMIDEACGFDPATDTRVIATLKCPECGKIKSVYVNPDEPKETAKILLPCPDCFSTAKGIPTPIYLDKKGKELKGGDAK